MVQNFFTSPQCQAGRREADREYGYTVAVYRPSKLHPCTTRRISSLISGSFVATLSVPRSPGANLNKDSFNTFPPRQSLFAHLSRCTRPCPGRLGRTSSIPISCGALGACVCHIVGEHAGVANHDTAFYLPPAEQLRVIFHKFAGTRASVAPPASSSTSSCTTSTVGSNASLTMILCHNEKLGYTGVPTV